VDDFSHDVRTVQCSMGGETGRLSSGALFCFGKFVLSVNHAQE
jgi:hypothetical protein